jgi:hypothetical protein
LGVQIEIEGGAKWLVLIEREKGRMTLGTSAQIALIGQLSITTNATPNQLMANFAMSVWVNKKQVTAANILPALQS